VPAAREFPAGDEWREVRVRWDEIGVDATGVLGLVWSAGGEPGSFEVFLDEVALIPGRSPAPGSGGADGVARAFVAGGSAPEIARAFVVESTTGVMLVRRLSDGRQWAYGGARLDSGFLPASSFKIVNAAVALETGVVSGPDERFAWDGVERQFDGWNRDHTLASAMAASAVPVYQEVARRIGVERMAEWLRRLGYGNAAVDGGLERFWLDGGLRTSAREQVQFLARFVGGATPLAAGTVAAVEEMILQDRGHGWSLHAKTGWAFEARIGWWVGWTRHGDETYVFALNMPINDSRLDPPRRARIGRAALEAVGALP
jgi:beta-lactamase class D